MSVENANVPPRCHVFNSYLLFEKIDHNNRCRISNAFAELSSNELDLNEGRFAYFSVEPQINHVVLHHRAMTAHSLRRWAEELIEWIAEHSTEPWSLSAWASFEEPEPILDFSFANGTTAVVFALVWR